MENEQLIKETKAILPCFILSTRNAKEKTHSNANFPFVSDMMFENEHVLKFYVKYFLKLFHRLFQKKTRRLFLEGTF
jgi:hypothetical protein